MSIQSPLTILLDAEGEFMPSKVGPKRLTPCHLRYERSHLPKTNGWTEFSLFSTDQLPNYACTATHIHYYNFKVSYWANFSTVLFLSSLLHAIFNSSTLGGFHGKACTDETLLLYSQHTWSHPVRESPVIQLCGERKQSDWKPLLQTQMSIIHLWALCDY